MRSVGLLGMRNVPRVQQPAGTFRIDSVFRVHFAFRLPHSEWIRLDSREGLV